ncbi:MAG TPA: deoxyguanosinetriphosphate triphosphohydrolase [candidate division Zixibacteria bacterium]|nr:deoxyguanosinetriphosphate triphosphohydrolase [candidate division Zixibacteria bacterium]
MGLLTRPDIENQERALLASYAALSGDSRGRRYPQAPHPLRTAFQRDRDRIIHSTAFRRMEYKTQVFVSYEQDHFRTRLTHTIEVSQISRTLARNLRLNEDLAAAVALVHDLGHTPFGHAGEDVLDKLLSEHGGFNHNRQSLRIVDYLEQRYPDHPGLNLSYEVREGIVKHETKVKISLPEFDDSKQPTLEASLVDTADEIAYNAHDIDDGLSSGLIEYADLSSQSFFPILTSTVRDQVRTLEGDQRRYALIRGLIDRMASDVMAETLRRIEEARIVDLEAVRHSPYKLVGYSTEIKEAVAGLKSYLMQNLYRHPQLKLLSERAREIITRLYETFRDNPGMMPLRFQKMLEKDPLEIVTADYVAGMTDRFAEKIFSGL